MKSTDIPVVHPKPASSPALVRLFNDYQAATEQYRVIVGYLKAAIEVLPKTECQLLLEFAETAKNHCARLHRTIGDRLSTHRKSAGKPSIQLPVRHDSNPIPRGIGATFRSVSGQSREKTGG